MASVRPYRAQDWASFIALDLETGLSALCTASDDARTAFRKRWPSLLRERMGFTEHGPTRDGAVLLVLEDGHEYAGHLWLIEQEDLFTGIRGLYVLTIAVVERFRRRGFARLLMQHAEQVARERGLPAISLGVFADNSGAIALYEKLGYATTRRTMLKSLI